MFDRAGRRKYLNSAERKAFFRVTQEDPDLQQRSFCLTLFYTGCRVSEALNLTFERVDASQKTLVFETLKRRKSGCFRSIPVPGTLVTLMKDLISSQMSGKVWKHSRRTAYRMVKRNMNAADISGVMACPKGLRHSYAIACIVGGVPLTTVQKWMGHARIETTAKYLEFMGEEERKLARRIWPSSER